MEIIHYVVNISLHSKARLSADLCLREKTLSNSLPAGTRRSIVWALMINFLRGFWICAFRYTYICVTLSRERPEPIHYSFCWLVQRFRVKGPFSPGGWYGTEGGGRRAEERAQDEENHPGIYYLRFLSHLRWQADDTGDVLTSPDDLTVHNSANSHGTNNLSITRGFILSCSHVLDLLSST